ncbi:MAG: DNA polymerase II [archaeon GW2011_AR3]|nr:MAG: DNA polymerase II [archaeon GW2011_AR3]MBS3109449.1 DNA polymerase II [Candidatus Woesearchaeota archaeon]
MDSINGFIVYPTYRIRVVDNLEKAFIYLYGRLESGESFLVIKHTRPYFFIKKADRKKAEAVVKADYEDTGLRDFDENEVSKVVLWNPRDVPGAKQVLVENGIGCYEADIRFTYRYLIDQDIKGCIKIEGKHQAGREAGEKVDRVYYEPGISPTVYQPNLRILSMDIETDGEATRIFSISIYAEDYKKVLIAKPGDFQHAESFNNEEEMLLRFKELVDKLDPDIITGWNLIDFDLKVIKERMERYKIPFALGRGNEASKLRMTDSFFLDSKADVVGRAVLDGIHLMKMSFVKMEDYKLNTVAKSLLGKEKIIQQGESWKEEIEKAFEKDPQHLINYNLHDSELVYEILEKQKLVELTIRRSMLTRMQLDRVNASVASLDSLYLKELQKNGYVAPSSAANESDERIKGGFVRKSVPGIYENIIVLDFKSLYPSIMRTMNIDPLDFVKRDRIHSFKKDELIEAPNGAHFRNRDGILPRLIQQLWEQRDRAKKENNKLESNAIKILMNSLFGVLANPTCRFYNLEIANAITHFGQFFIKLCAEKIADRGFMVIYGDTDSIFVKPETVLEYKDAVRIGHELQDGMNEFFRKYIRDNYGRDSVLELEFEKVYKKFLMPKVRGSEEGAKKRYAGIVEVKGQDKMEFVGLEFVRRDWTGLAKKFQLEMLELIFKGERIDEFVNDFVDKLKKGEYDGLLIYKKAIRKSVDEYTKTTPPHIKAARMMGRKKSGLIEYYMTENGPEPVEMRKSRIDYQHYIEKQVKPLADSVLVFFDKSFDEVIKGHKQSSLADFG